MDVSEYIEPDLSAGSNGLSGAKVCLVFFPMTFCTGYGRHGLWLKLGSIIYSMYEVANLSFGFKCKPCFGILSRGDEGATTSELVARGIHIPNIYSLFNGEPVGAT